MGSSLRHATTLAQLFDRNNLTPGWGDGPGEGMKLLTAADRFHVSKSRNRSPAPSSRYS
jgi:hypothetical protein